MTGAPDKIWVEDTSKDWFDDSGVWGVDQENQYDVEYTRSDIADTLRDSVMSRNDLLAELARNVEGRQERIDTLEAEVARLREALMLITREYDPSDYGGIAEAMFTIAGEALTKPPGDTNE